MVDVKDIVLIVLFITLSFLLFVISIVAVIITANKQRMKQQASFEKELRTVEQEVQEETLSRVARELHDNIGQLLTVAHIQIKKNSIKHPEIKEELQPISHTIDDTVEQVKALGKSLNTDLLKDKGLLENISQEVNRIRSLERFQIHYTYDDSPLQLSQDYQLLLFRTFQEIVNNILKYAEAKEVTILLKGQPFELIVQDDGNGFNLEQEMNKGMGLRNVIKRTKLANLTCDITTSTGKGCIFKIYQSV